MRKVPTVDPPVARPTEFLVGGHALLLAQLSPSWRWTATMDGRLLDGTFQSQAEAWEAGIREAARADAAAGPR